MGRKNEDCHLGLLIGIWFRTVISYNLDVLLGLRLEMY